MTYHRSILSSYVESRDVRVQEALFQRVQVLCGNEDHHPGIVDLANVKLPCGVDGNDQCAARTDIAEEVDARESRGDFSFS